VLNGRNSAGDSVRGPGLSFSKSRYLDVFLIFIQRMHCLNLFLKSAYCDLNGVPFGEQYAVALIIVTATLAG
jgi:hypothetical protein